MSENLFRRLPAVHDVLAVESLRELVRGHGHSQVVAAVRAELGDLRRRMVAGDVLEADLDTARVAERVAGRLARQVRAKLLPVINATGIVLHTNLGRAPIAACAAEAARQAAAGYLNLELDLETGKRSSRQDAIRDWLCRLTGAESATAVNNNAAATVLVLRTLARGKEVIISRGQLIEIGGSFRIPEIMAVSGAILREVGTTNITRLTDYASAITPNTGALLHVHSSNYRIRGFSEAVAVAELVGLGQKQQVPVIDDIGSGALIDFSRFGFEGEPLARASIAAGADLVLFSGDKLLGGPQAGIIAGKKQWIDKVEKDPLMRAFRLDKMTLAALEATLRIYLHEDRALAEIPVLRMLGVPLEQLQERAQKLAGRLAELEGIHSATVSRDEAYVGGGSLPDQAMPTWVVEMKARHVGEEELAYRLRVGNPAVMVRIKAARVLLDVRTVFEEQETALVQAVAAATKGA